jgi:hypothetical protein
VSPEKKRWSPDGQPSPAVGGNEREAPDAEEPRFVSDNDVPLDPELFVRVAAAVDEGLSRLEQLMASGAVVRSQWQWHSVGKQQNGLPDITQSFGFQGPPDYERAYSRMPKPEPWEIPLGELDTFQELQKYLRSRDDLLAKLLHPFEYRPADDPFILHYKIDELALNLIDRYMHVYKDARCEESRLLPLYLERERGLINDTLPLDVVVPLLFLKCDFDEYKLGEDCRVERLSDDVHIARAVIGGYWDNPIVRSSASHALRMSGYTVPNPTQLLSQAAAYPLDRVDQFFAAIRIVTGLDTGYAQLLAMPRNWTHGYRAWLPSVEGTSIRAYPRSFEDYRWLQPIGELRVENAREVGEVFSSLQANTENRIHIAARRLNRCFVRDDEEDTVLDAVTGLEALLSDKSREGLVYRLALRIAALARLGADRELSPKETFRTVKQIYDYRSCLVHGDKKASARREIVLPGDRRELAVALAVRYLRFALRTLLKHPVYCRPEKIDEDLLLGSEGEEGRGEH